ncbi:hypothetical protein D3OALGA1CA_860 [Olavius algarvensis associated proteobacterium Delta 3]|nr:hypothetical protein D3OALGA1CA_860 [Olavius algarvensis associated proteobacterium Delta 3]CAB5143278.1 hypothetical protein D3OALGB2SA_4363 [Olavius algarvensis associated proteobacterium Delta 3]
MPENVNLIGIITKIKSLHDFMKRDVVAHWAKGAVLSL